MLVAVALEVFGRIYYSHLISIDSNFRIHQRLLPL